MSIAEGYQDAHGLSDNDFEEGGEEDGGKQKRKRQQSFPRLLYTLLEKEDPTIVGWSEDGKSFRIHDIKEFCHSVLPKYFRHSKITSLQRQLNLYGFVHITKGSLAGSYEHPEFARGEASSLELQKRPVQVARGASKLQEQLNQWASSADQLPGVWPLGLLAAMPPAPLIAPSGARTSIGSQDNEKSQHGTKRPSESSSCSEAERHKKARLNATVLALEQAPWPQLAAMHDTTPFAPLAETLSASLGSTYALALCLTLLSGVPFQGSAVAAAPAAADGPPAKPPLPRAVPASSSTSSSSSSGRAAKSSTQPKPIAPALTGKAPPPEPERALI